MRALIRAFLFIGLAVLFSCGQGHAQWKLLAPALAGEYFDGTQVNSQYGAIYYLNNANKGFLWAGCQQLWESLDQGITWQKNNFTMSGGDVITDINFYDSAHGVICTFAGKVYLTRNAGNNWSQVLASSVLLPTTQFSQIAFDGSPSVIHALSIGAFPSPHGEFFTSINGGGTWTASDPGGPYGAYCQSFCVGNDGTIYVLCSHYDISMGVLEGFLSISTDNGQSWQQQIQSAVDGDSYSICADSCDPKIIYVANEDYTSTVNGLSDLFYTTDAGNSWTSTASFPVKYLTGGMTKTLHALYATSLADGVLRSIDSGKTWKNIGPGNDSIPCSFDARNITCANDNIVFVLDSQGGVWGTTNSGGDSVREPNIKDFIVLSRDTLFAGDSIATCDSALKFISFARSGCPLPTIAKMDIIGNGKTSYSTIGPVRDSFGVKFKPDAVGLRDAQLILTLSSGTFDTVILQGKAVGAQEIFTLTKDSLFKNEFLVYCDSFPKSHFVPFVHFGCPAPDIVSGSFIGPGAQSYSFIPAAGDSIGVALKPISFGAQDANLVLKLTNGTYDTLALSAFISKVPYTLSFVPDTLFRLDSAFTCDSVTGRKINLKVTGCPLPKVTAKTITGVNASSFEIVSAPDTLTGNDDVLLTLKPDATGKLNANVVLTLDDGTTVTLPVTGYGLPPIPLAIITHDESTDTIGGTVRVPISISGLQKPETVSLIVHYDTLLKYEGTFSASTGKQLDAGGAQEWSGRSEIIIPNVIPPGDSTAWAVFDVFNDTLAKQHVWFDSVIVRSAIPPCRYGYAPLSIALSVITDTSGCGINTISRFIHYGQMPQFALKPNPTGGDILLTSTADLGATEIIIYDMLGSQRARTTATLHKNIPVQIMLPEANGIYTLRIAGVYDVRVVVNR